MATHRLPIGNEPALQVNRGRARAACEGAQGPQSVAGITAAPILATVSRGRRIRGMRLGMQPGNNEGGTLPPRQERPLRPQPSKSKQQGEN